VDLEDQPQMVVVQEVEPQEQDQDQLQMQEQMAQPTLVVELVAVVKVWMEVQMVVQV
jgi:hypothetical protein|tara:strand:+ start:557 stop:727 length:171 start_codon:yes stop_codon:yes gene_type:complete